MAQADLVAVATLQKPTVFERPAGHPVYRAVLQVHQHLAGDSLKSKRCTLEWMKPRLSTQLDLTYAVGRKGIWLLERAETGGYLVDHPAFFRPLSDLAEVRAAVKAPRYLVDASQQKACCITLEIRTFQPRLEVRDFISVQGDKILLHGQAQLVVRGQMGELLRAKPGCLVRNKADRRAVVVERGRPHRIRIDLSKCFSLRRSFREVFHLEWGASKRRSPLYSFEL